MIVYRVTTTMIVYRVTTRFIILFVSLLQNNSPIKKKKLFSLFNLRISPQKEPFCCLPLGLEEKNIILCRA